MNRRDFFIKGLKLLGGMAVLSLSGIPRLKAETPLAPSAPSIDRIPGPFEKDLVKGILAMNAKETNDVLSPQTFSNAIACEKKLVSTVKISQTNFRSVYLTEQANFEWHEWGIFEPKESIILVSEWRAGK